MAKRLKLTALGPTQFQHAGSERSGDLANPPERWVRPSIVWMLNELSRLLRNINVWASILFILPLMFLEAIHPGGKPLYRPPDFSMPDSRRGPMLLSRRLYSLHLQAGSTVPTPFP